jgi:3-oxoadipate enol-lactonase
VTPTDHGTVDNDGVRIAWQSFGGDDRPAIVFSHSLGLDSSTWLPQVEALVDDFRIVLVDTRGHGNSTLSSEPFTLERLAGDLLAAATGAGADRFHLCGLSMGGMIALWAAINQPERLRSIVVANTAARIGTQQSWGERAAAIRSAGMRSISEAAKRRFFSPDLLYRHPEWFEETIATLESCDPIAYIACCEMLGRTDLTTDVAAIHLPTLIIAGDLDPTASVDQARWLHEQIAGSELEVLKGAAHLSSLDRAEDFTAALRRFVERH